MKMALMMKVFQILENSPGEAVCSPLLVRLVEWSQTAPVSNVVERIAANVFVNVSTEILCPEASLVGVCAAPVEGYSKVEETDTGEGKAEDGGDEEEVSGKCGLQWRDGARMRRIPLTLEGADGAVFDAGEEDC
ncbi:MAG: hypothetical protein Q9174_007018 [Haloplaca sp. 1 TL-2023]